MTNLLPLLLILWTAHPSADVAGYRMYWGSESRRYHSYVDAPANQASLSVTGRTFVVVSAVNWAGLESEFSDELELRPITIDFESTINLTNWETVHSVTRWAGQTNEFFRLRIR